MRRLLLLIVFIAVGAVGALFVVDWQARRADEVLVVEVPFSATSRDAVTTGRIIFVQQDKADNADLLAHELVHVCQWEEQGIEFLWSYLNEYRQNLTELRDLDAAYAEISFEEEARLGEVDCDLGRYVIIEP
ncbi:MAG: eCIS core domain-containing protein [Acidimicrobiales bacterium]